MVGYYGLLRTRHADIDGVDLRWTVPCCVPGVPRSWLRDQ
jgi:hypothetical protein